MTLTVGSLFSGIGGLDLGLERAGMKVIWQSEIDPFASKVLAHHWPDVPNLGDITTIDWSSVERPDLICGGYPCQPFSQAGKRLGADDPRHLWPAFAGAIRHLRPRCVLLENVDAHLSLGFDVVLADLAALGFDAEWSVVPACAVGAPHMRKRLFVVANANGEGWRWERRWQQLTASGTATWDVRDQPEPSLSGVAHGLSGLVDRRRALGNAVVPQVAELIGRRIIASAPALSASGMNQ